MASEKQYYEFTEAGYFLGTFYNVGDVAAFHPKQVEHDLHRMKPYTPAAAKPAKAPKAAASE